jgi:hypothetical protein
VVARIVHEGAAAEVGASFVAARPPPPVVDVTGIANGDVIAGRRQIGATVRSGEVRRIELLVDDQSRAAATNQPFVLAWDAGGEQPGRRRVTVRLTDAAGVPRDQSYTVEVVGASPTPVPPTATRVAPLPTPLPRPTVEAVPPSEPNELTRTWLPIGAGAALVVALAALAAAIARRPAPAAAVASASATGGPPDEDRTIDMNTLSGGAVALARGVLAASAMPRARLRTVRDGEPHEIALTGGELSIGRGQENTVVLEDALVSRRHARIVLVDGSYWLEDLESRNGSRVNDEDVARHQLVGGETIAIGDTMFAFVLDPSAGEPATNGMGEVAPDVAVRA